MTTDVVAVVGPHATERHWYARALAGVTHRTLFSATRLEGAPIRPSRQPG